MALRDDVTARLLRGFSATPAGERRAYLEANRAELTRARLRALSVDTMGQVQAGLFAMAAAGGEFLELAGAVAGEPLLRFDGAFVPAYIALAQGDGRAARRALEPLSRALLTYGMDPDDLTLCRQILAVKRGAAAVQLGDSEALQTALRETAALLKQASNPVIDVELGNLAGILLRYVGQLDNAIQALGEVAEAADALPNPVLAAQARINKAGAELASGRPTDAEETLDSALQAAPKAFAVELQLQRGATLSLLDRPQEARAALQAAQKTARDLGNASGEARALLAECTLLEEQADPARCRALLSQARPLIEAQKQPLLSLPYAAALARLALREKAPARAEALARQALPEAKDTLYQAARLDLLLVLSHALILQKKWDAADTVLQEAQELIERLRASMNDPTERNQFGQVYADIYVTHAYVALSRRRPEEAFALSERLRGLTLSELMHSTDWRVQTRSLSPADASRIARFRQDEAAACVALSNAVTTDEREVARTRREKIARDRKALEQALARRAPLLALRGWGALPPVGQAAQALLAGKKNTCYLSFLAQENATIVFGILRRNGRPVLDWRVLPALTGPALEQAVRAFHTACSLQGETGWEEKGQLLSYALLEPIRAWWESAENLIIVPDGALAYLPWAALRDRKTRKLFGEGRTLSIAPSLTALYYLSQRPPTPNRRFVGYGGCKFRADLSPLAESGPEVKAIGALLGSQSIVRLAQNANAPRLQTDASAARILHLATHGRAEESRPLESAVFLTPTPTHDGIVTTRDLLTLPLDTDLVTLSACQSALGTRFLGEGIVGPAWGLLAAGSRSVLASHWSVSDSATRLLMTTFYKELAKDRSRAEALRSAQKTVRSRPQYAHPSYWAAFALHGVG